MKKITLLFAALMLLLSVTAHATELRLNLENPDVRKCLIEATKYEGWELRATYLNANEKLVMVFVKGTDVRTYTSI
ncbi:hypothetical protein KFZ70_04265 [Tamlana fucoidanivorans]|uniref:Uncharacterized protein n=1 Tax=Allotamlana fucoidanivorans TaxID=2583814 RepID=A0A5C4SDM2_9FLAO|nr:hypothetical protein [Tamlana fucoidanivorans]TNJ41342.1 hypothetical protein FGF67_16040 [Tamlana fucoidanivorans]